MFLSKSASLSLLGALYLLIPTSCARTCYSYAGKEITDQRKCPDSEACCGADDKCLPNRLCQSDGLADNLLVRGTCTSEDWDDGECAQICKFSTCFSSFGPSTTPTKSNDCHLCLKTF